MLNTTSLIIIYFPDKTSSLIVCRMAVFGFQICFTFIMASFLQKLSPIYSLGRWLVANGSLVWYLYPSDDELRKAAGKPLSEKNNGKVKNRHGTKRHTAEEKTFKVPKQLDINLDMQPVTPQDIITLKNYTEYEWLVNYTLFGIFVYIGTEIFYEVWMPEREINLSVIWLGLSLWFAIKNLLAILWLYAKSKASGEISMSIAYGLVSFIAALSVLMVNENVLEFGLHKSSDESTVNDEKTFVHGNPFSVSRVKLLLATWSSVIGVLFVFPAIRQAQMYLDALKYCQGYSFKAFALHFNFIATLIIACLWLKPIARDVIQHPGLDMTDSIQLTITDAQFDIFRIVFVLFVCFVRLVLMRPHLQAYLNIAYDKVQKLRKESGLISNIEFQRMILQIFYYLGVVATQYICPLVVMLCSALCLKTMGGYSWQAVLPTYEDHMAVVTNEPSPINSTLVIDDSQIYMVEKMQEHINAFKALFTPLFVRGIVSYMLWWIAANWFTASCVGVLYHSYLSE